MSAEENSSSVRGRVNPTNAWIVSMRASRSVAAATPHAPARSAAGHASASNAGAWRHDRTAAASESTTSRPA